MTKLLRFRDLQERGIIPNWPTLRARINRDGFPRGRMLGANTRAWTEAEVETWIKSSDGRPGPAWRSEGPPRCRRTRRCISDR
jgi:hypothetical protein